MIMGIKNMIEVEKDHIELVRKKLNVTQVDIDRDLDTLVAWYNMQPHLPKSPIDRRFVEFFLIRKKYSMESTKLAIDLYFSAWSIMPEFYINRDPEEIAKRGKMFGTIVPLPIIDNHGARCWIQRIEQPQNDLNFIDSFKFALMIGIYRTRHEYGGLQRHIYDLKNVSLAHLTKINPAALKQGYILDTALMGTSIASIHFFNGGSYMDRILALLKPLMKPKVFNRIYFHNSYEEMHQYFDKDVLPNEYGGKAGTYDEIVDRWVTLFGTKEAKDWFAEQDKLRSDESKRTGPSLSSELGGVPGSFRQINVD